MNDSESVRQQIIRRAEENLRRKELERQSKPEPPEQVVIVKHDYSFRADRFVTKIIMVTGVVFTLDILLLIATKEIQNINVSEAIVLGLFGVPVSILLAYLGFFIAQVIAKTYWLVTGCGWICLLVVYTFVLFAILVRIV